MPVLSPITNTCWVCNNNDTLRMLKVELAFLQRQTKMKWVFCKDELVNSRLIADGVEARYLVDKDGAVTNMPNYPAFAELWQRGMHQSPFDFNWEKFDSHDEWDRAYLKLVWLSMDEQISMWECDDVTACHPVFWQFAVFTVAIQRLHSYVTGHKTGEQEKNAINV